MIQRALCHISLLDNERSFVAYWALKATSTLAVENQSGFIRTITIRPVGRLTGKGRRFQPNETVTAGEKGEQGGLVFRREPMMRDKKREASLCRGQRLQTSANK